MYAVAADGVNFWEEGGGSGRETCKGQIDVRPFDAAKSCGGFSGEVAWTKPDGAVVLGELRADRRLCLSRNQADPAHLANLSASAAGKIGEAQRRHYFGLGMRFAQAMDKTGRFFFNPENAVGVAVSVSRVTPAKWSASPPRWRGSP